MQGIARWSWGIVVEAVRGWQDDRAVGVVSFIVTGILAIVGSQVKAEDRQPWIWAALAVVALFFLYRVWRVTYSRSGGNLVFIPPFYWGLGHEGDRCIAYCPWCMTNPDRARPLKEETPFHGREAILKCYDGTHGEQTFTLDVHHYWAIVHDPTCIERRSAPYPYGRRREHEEAVKKSKEAQPKG